MASTQKSCINDPVIVKKPEVILLDIEGTITNLAFVSKILFPFINQNIKPWLIETYDRNETKDLVERFRKTQAIFPDLPKIPTEPRSLVINKTTDYVLKLVGMKKRISEVKQLQILIWVWGYEKGLLKGHVYDEVTTAMHYWKTKDRIKIYIFSSGMIMAQKLLLCYTNHGNCLPLISGFFDTSVGEKTAKESYENICEDISSKPEKVLFLTDSFNEAIAGVEAGLCVIVVKREDTFGKDIDKMNDRIPIVNSLDSIRFKDK